MNSFTDVVSKFGTYALSDRQSQFLRWAQGMPVSWVGRRAALILRKSVLMADQPVVDAVVDHLNLRLYMRDNVSERKFLFMPQFFDRFERDLLQRELKPGGIFIDIGANAGIYALTAAAVVGHEGRVLAIEPNPLVLDRLKFNMSLNGFDHQIMVEQSAVSDQSGAFDLVLDETNLGGASLALARSAEKISVRCQPLLDIVLKYHLPRVDALKIDIEGAEDKALMPYFERAPETLWPRLIIIEDSSWAGDLKGILEKCGYKMIRKTRMNLVWERG